jgi:GGDEF domain-containing protein
MGVPYGQGYILGKPNDGFKSLRGEMQEFLGKHLKRRDSRVAGRDYPIEKMARYGVTLPSSSPNSEVARKFSRMPDMESVVLVDEARIEGLIMRDRFDELYKPSGEDDPATSAPISALMDRQPLVVESSTTLEDVAQRATYRRTMRFHDDIVVGRAGEYVGVVPVRALLEALSTRHVNRLKYAHPLTGLPGAPIIEEACDSRLQSEQPTVVIHVGIAHFRAFNEYFGLAMGDEALLTAARLLEQTLLKLGTSDDFLGHIGGDNFVLLTNPELAPAICSACLSEFELLAPHLYTPEHRRDGAFETVDGQGKSLRTPLMFLRMTGVSTSKRQLTHFRQAMQLLKSVQRAAITTPERRFIID